jgi:hypothetical protein
MASSHWSWAEEQKDRLPRFSGYEEVVALTLNSLCLPETGQLGEKCEQRGGIGAGLGGKLAGSGGCVLFFWQSAKGGAAAA